MGRSGEPIKTESNFVQSGWEIRLARPLGLVNCFSFCQLQKCGLWILSYWHAMRILAH